MITRRRFVIGQECRKLIENAAKRCISLTLTNRRDNAWEVHKANFLSLQANKLVISQPIPDSHTGPMEPSPGQEVAITFKKGYNKCLFMTRVIGQEQHELELGVNVPALVVYCPEQLEKIQRRSYNRVEPPADRQIAVTFVKHDDDEVASQYQGNLANLSAGGMAIWANKQCLENIQEGEIYQLDFTPLDGQSPIVVQGRLRYAMPQDSGDNADELQLGFQFIGLEMTEQGRSMIRRIGRVVSVYQRQQPIATHRELRERH